MRRRMLRLASLVWPLGLAGLSSTPVMATPESRAGVLFLLISPSTRVNGMGQAGVALADDPGGYYNPAAPALQARSHTLSTVNYVGTMPLLPGLADDLGYSYNAFQVGWNSNTRFNRVRLDRAHADDAARSGRLLSVSAAVAYYRTALEFSETRTGERGEFLGTSDSFERAHNFVFSTAVHYLIEVGFGFTVKKITSDLGEQGVGLERGLAKAQGTAYDYGLLVRIPLVDIAEYSVGRQLTLANRLRPHVDLMRGVTWNNRGDAIEYIEASQPDPLPSHRRIGWAGSAGLSWVHGARQFDLVSCTRSVERYERQIEDLEDPATFDDKEGWELSFLDTYEIRRGTYDDDDGEIHLDTEGYTVKSDGIFKLLAAYQASRSPSSSEDRSGGVFRFLFEHLSVSWSRFEYDGAGSPVGDKDHVQLSVAF